MSRSVSIELSLRAMEDSVTPLGTPYDEILDFSFGEKQDTIYLFDYSADTPVEVPFGQITDATFLFIQSDYPIKIYFGDPATASYVGPSTLFLLGGFVSESGFSELHVLNDNEDEEAVEARIIIAGDTPSSS